METDDLNTVVTVVMLFAIWVAWLWHDHRRWARFLNEVDGTLRQLKETQDKHAARLTKQSGDLNTLASRHMNQAIEISELTTRLAVFREGLASDAPEPSAPEPGIPLAEVRALLYDQRNAILDGIYPDRLFTNAPRQEPPLVASEPNGAMKNPMDDATAALIYDNDPNQPEMYDMTGDALEMFRRAQTGTISEGMAGDPVDEPFFATVPHTGYVSPTTNYVEFDDNIVGVQTQGLPVDLDMEG